MGLLNRRRWTVFSFVLLLSSIGLSESAVYVVDPTSPDSKVSFLSATYFYDVPGTFKEFGGEIEFDPADWSKSHVTMIVNTATLDTKNKDRDGHLRGPDFFGVKTYPQATFKSVKFEKVAEGKFVMKGRLDFHGVTNMTQWQVSSIKSYHDGSGRDRVVFQADTTVDRKDFGIFWNADPNTYNPLNEKKNENFASLLMNTLGNKFIKTDDVKISVQLEAVRK